MIETKEQYETIKKRMMEVPSFIYQMKGGNKNVIELIEALREVARAGNQLMDELDLAWNEGRLPYSATNGETVRRYNKARAALSDWITED